MRQRRDRVRHLHRCIAKPVGFNVRRPHKLINFFRSDPGMTTLAVNPNGAGKLSYRNWFSNGSQSSMSGTVAWTCH